MTTTLRRTIVATTAALTAFAALAAGTGTAAGNSQPLVDAVAAPQGFIRVTDDTGTISIAVPADWQYRTASDPLNRATPTIDASTGFDPPACDGCTEAPHLPSFHVRALPYEPIEIPQDCEGDSAAVPFDNGAFVGYRMNLTGCDAVIDEVVANEVGGNFNVAASMVYSSVGATPDIDFDASAAIFDVMLASIQWTGAPYPGGPAANPIFPYAAFGEVPQLGQEPVRGTGCGADGSVGDVVPDGIWAGFTDAPAPGAPLSVDLLCIFTPESAPGVLAGGTATVLLPDGATEPNVNYLVVNNNERERTVPTSPALELRDAVVEGDGCVEGAFIAEVDHREYQAWINIEGGVATWVIWGCDWFGDGSTPAPAPAPAPDPTTPASNSEEALLQADCAVLQNTIWEGDMFLDVDYPADGQPFTESLRRAIEASRDFFSYEASQVRSELAQSAFAQYYAEWDSLLQAGIYTTTNVQAVWDAGWAALAPVLDACGLPGPTR